MPIPLPGDAPWFLPSPKPPKRIAATLTVAVALILPGTALGQNHPVGMRPKADPVGMRPKVDPVGMRHRVSITLTRHYR